VSADYGRTRIRTATPPRRRRHGSCAPRAASSRTEVVHATEAEGNRMVRTSASEPTVLVGTVEAVPVTAGATTSRVLVDNDAVRVVAFAFDAGEQLTEHTAALPVVVQVLRGAVRFAVGDDEHELGSGDGVYLPAHASHALEALEPTLLTLVMVRH
jgi:quercetin dioxygenase-like cupin family protein